MPPADQRREHGRDQAVDVEQRHDVQAAVAGRQRQRRRRCGAPRRRGCGARAAPSSGREVVPEVCRMSADVVLPPPAPACDRSAARAAASEPPGRLLRRDRRQPSNVHDTVPAGDRDGRPGVVADRHDQRLGLEVGQVEVELVVPVGRIERRSRGRGDGEEGGRHLRPVRQHDRHPVAAADAERIQLFCGGVDQTPQAAKAERRPIGCQDRSGLGGCGWRRWRRSRPWRARLLLGEYSDVAGT